MKRNKENIVQFSFFLFRLLTTTSTHKRKSKWLNSLVKWEKNENNKRKKKIQEIVIIYESFYFLVSHFIIIIYFISFISAATFMIHHSYFLGLMNGNVIWTEKSVRILNNFFSFFTLLPFRERNKRKVFRFIARVQPKLNGWK